MYRTKKYNWNNFEEISLESNKLLFEITYMDPKEQYYCANTANMGGYEDVKSGKIEVPIEMGGCTMDDCGHGPVKLSDAINQTADWLDDDCVITGWEIKPCDENGQQVNRESSEFAKWIIENSTRVGNEKKAGLRNANGTLTGSNVIKFPKKSTG